MKIVIAPDSFKGSLSAPQVAESISRGLLKAEPSLEVTKVPMADGGEGTAETLVSALGGEMIEVNVLDPLLRPIKASYGLLNHGRTAIIEMAAASGLTLISPAERNPLKTSTFGTGQLIKAAMDQGCRHLIIGIGGSATNDGGMGMLTALGVKFLDATGHKLDHNGAHLGSIATIDMSGLDSRIGDCTIEAMCDVDNPLVGPKGAAFVFAPQKGADPNMVELLDANLRHYAAKVEQFLKLDVSQYPGAGAAGGLGAAVYAFLGGTLRRGIDIISETVALEQKIQAADLVITGEGMIDFQTQYGKTAFGVAKVAIKNKKPVIAIAGGIGRDAYGLYEHGFSAIFSIVDRPMTLEIATETAAELLENIAESIMRTLLVPAIFTSELNKSNRA